MKSLFVSVLFFAAVSAFPSAALADCTTSRVFTPNGTITCMTCCNEYTGQCYTNCF